MHIRSIISVAGPVIMLFAACSGEDDATPTPATERTPTQVESCAVDVERDVQVTEPFVCIDWPAVGSSIEQSVAIAGYAAGAFENNIVVEVRDDSGTVIARGNATSAGPDLGLVGPWALVLLLPVQPEGSVGTIRAFAESPRDGSVAFEESVAIRFGG